MSTDTVETAEGRGSTADNPICVSSDEEEDEAGRETSDEGLSMKIRY